MVNNALRLATVNSVGDFILFLAKCFVAVVTTIIAVLIFKFDSSLNFYAGPTLIVFIFAYFVSHCVISLYEVNFDIIHLLDRYVISVFYHWISFTAGHRYSVSMHL